MATLEHSFVSAAQLSTIQTDITGAETATLTESDYTESGTGPYTYTGQYEATADGDYTFTLTIAETPGGVSATWGSQSTTTTTSSVTVIDSWESGDTADYTTVSSGFVVNTNAPVYDGSNSLKNDGVGNDPEIYSSSGLNAYPTRGDTFRVRMNINTGHSVGVAWGGPDASNYYRLTTFDNYSTFRLYRFDSGSSNQIATDDNVSIPTGEWIYAEIDYGSTTITCTLYDASGTQLTSIQADDTTYTSSGFGVDHSDDGTNGVTAIDFANIL